MQRTGILSAANYAGCIAPEAIFGDYPEFTGVSRVLSAGFTVPADKIQVNLSPGLSCNGEGFSF
jgi:hypothetical protein